MLWRKKIDIMKKLSIIKNKKSTRELMRDDAIRAHVCCSNNKELLKKTNICGCFYCLKIFNPILITEWCDNGKTAICPFCGIDSIIYDNNIYPINREFLEIMHSEWFN